MSDKRMGLLTQGGDTPLSFHCETPAFRPASAKRRSIPEQASPALEVLIPSFDPRLWHWLRWARKRRDPRLLNSPMAAGGGLARQRLGSSTVEKILRPT